MRVFPSRGMNVPMEVSMGAARKKRDLMTVDEFLAWPGDGRRYDLVDGELRAHSAPSDEHGTILMTTGHLVTTHLRANRPDCRVVAGSGVRPKFRAKWNLRIPDLTVTCQPNVKGNAGIPSPSIIIEILSPSNAPDTWDNVRNYMTVPSVQEILVVHSTRVFAELLVRQPDGTWPSDAIGMVGSATLRLESIGFEAYVAELFYGTYLVG
jgi:Uma2 family endonuclease